MDGDPSSWLPFPAEDIEITADGSLEPGCCLLESGPLNLDISMTTQLNSLKQLWMTAAEEPDDGTLDGGPA